MLLDPHRSATQGAAARSDSAPDAESVSTTAAPPACAPLVECVFGSELLRLLQRWASDDGLVEAVNRGHLPSALVQVGARAACRASPHGRAAVSGGSG